MKKSFLAMSAAALLLVTSGYAEEHKGAHWDYDANGPSCWGGFA